MEKMSYVVGNVNGKSISQANASGTKSRTRQCACGKSPSFRITGHLPYPPKVSYPSCLATRATSSRSDGKRPAQEGALDPGNVLKLSLEPTSVTSAATVSWTHYLVPLEKEDMPKIGLL